MSWWISLEGPEVKVDNHMEGGTIEVGGTEEATMNVTYNYSQYFYKVFPEDGIRWLHGKTGVQTLHVLLQGLEILGVKRDDDYWASTPGNAGHVLKILAQWANEHPYGVWRVN